MSEEEKSTAISAGSEEITGSKIVRGVYKKPAASVQIPKKITVNLEDDVTKIFFQTHFNYKEATTKKDKPHFTSVVKLNGKEVGRAVWSDPDVYYEFEEHEGFLQVEIDLKKFYLQGENRLEFEIHLECWLEEQPWGGGAIKETTSAYDSGKIIVNLGSYTPPGPEPEISLKIFPTHSPGEDKANYINTDWGEPYRLELSLNNKTDFVLKKSSSFELFEDKIKRGTATLGKDLDPKQKIIVQTVKKAKTKATWEIQKDNTPGNKNTLDYFEWYEDIGGGEFGIKQKNKIYKYHATGYVEASNAGPWDLETEKISVNVRVPDYKIKAMGTHNDVMLVKNYADQLSIFSTFTGGGAGISIESAKGVMKKVLQAVARVAIFLGIPATAVSLVISIQGPEILAGLKRAMDDPPIIDKNYRKFVKFDYTGLVIPKTKLKNYANLIRGLYGISMLLQLCDITNSRYRTAQLKLDRKYSKMQYAQLMKFKARLNLKINEVVNKLLFFVKLVSRTKVKRMSDDVIKNLTKFGFNKKQITRIKKLRVASIKNKTKFVRTLIKLLKSLRAFGKSYVKLK